MQLRAAFCISASVFFFFLFGCIWSATIIQLARCSKYRRKKIREVPHILTYGQICVQFTSQQYPLRKRLCTIQLGKTVLKLCSQAYSAWSHRMSSRSCDAMFLHSHHLLKSIGKKGLRAQTRWSDWPPSRINQLFLKQPHNLPQAVALQSGRTQHVLLLLFAHCRRVKPTK